MAWSWSCCHVPVSRGLRRWCHGRCVHGLVVVVVIKLPCCHVHAWMAPVQSSNAAQSSSARPPMVLTCRRHACHVSHVDGGCHVVVMWIGATRAATGCAGVLCCSSCGAVVRRWRRGGDMSLSCLCKTWIAATDAWTRPCMDRRPRATAGRGQRVRVTGERVDPTQLCGSPLRLMWHAH